MTDDSPRAQARRAWLARVRESVDEDASAPLWRAAQVFRALSLVYAIGYQVSINGQLDRPRTAAVLGVVLLVWSVACAVAYLTGFGRNWKWVGAEIVMTVALLLSTSSVASTTWIDENQPWPTTLWACNAVISAAILGGAAGGALTGLLVWAASVFVKGQVNLNFGRNAQLIQLLFLGLVVGWAATSGRRNHELLTQAARYAAAGEERDRLARHVHDGVLQALALISRRGREIGGDTTALAEMAGEQERALRRFLTERADEDRAYGDPAPDEGGRVDLAALLRRYAGEDVSVSTPREAVTVPARIGAEVDGAVGNALDNVVRHAGARTVSVSVTVDDDLTIGVTDDGVGIGGDVTRSGLANLAARAEECAGQFSIAPAPGGGTRLRWSAPLP